MSNTQLAQSAPDKTSDPHTWLEDYGPETFEELEQLWKMRETKHYVSVFDKYRIRHRGSARFIDCGPGTTVLAIWSEKAESAFYKILEVRYWQYTDGMGVEMYRAYLDHMEHD